MKMFNKNVLFLKKKLKKMYVSKLNTSKSVICLFAVFLMIFVSCRQENFRTDNGIVWNTTFHVIYDLQSELGDSVRRVMRDVELSLSPFNEASLITSVNRSDTPVRVDSRIAEILDASKKVNEMSNGAFDPTVAPLINLWGFGYENTSCVEPLQNVIDSVMSAVGIRDCYIEDGYLIKKSPATQFNFSAITKGYGVDEVGRMLYRNGCGNYMVEIGGEIVMAGHNPNGKKWRIQIDAPVENDTSVVHRQLLVVELTDCGVATSGNYRNFKTGADGKRYGHTISPVTGCPVITSTLSATVIAPNCMLADALATACMAMDAEDALKMIDNIDGVSCMLVVAGDGGKWNLKKSLRFPV